LSSRFDELVAFLARVPETIVAWADRYDAEHRREIERMVRGALAASITPARSLPASSSAWVLARSLPATAVSARRKSPSFRTPWSSSRRFSIMAHLPPASASSSSDAEQARLKE
jgi:hypothetical protein